MHYIGIWTSVEIFILSCINIQNTVQEINMTITTLIFHWLFAILIISGLVYGYKKDNRGIIFSLIAIQAEVYVLLFHKKDISNQSNPQTLLFQSIIVIVCILINQLMLIHVSKTHKLYTISSHIVTVIGIINRFYDVENLKSEVIH